jgi:hypothetical protein
MTKRNRSSRSADSRNRIGRNLKKSEKTTTQYALRRRSQTSLYFPRRAAAVQLRPLSPPDCAHPANQKRQRCALSAQRQRYLGCTHWLNPSGLCPLRSVLCMQSQKVVSDTDRHGGNCQTRVSFLTFYNLYLLFFTVS